MNGELRQILSDLASNAPIERGLAWLRSAEQTEDAATVEPIRQLLLNGTPEEILSAFINLHWACNALRVNPARSNALRYITNLQFSVRMNL